MFCTYFSIFIVLLLTLQITSQIYYERAYHLMPTQDTFIHGTRTSLFRNDFLEVGRRSDGLDSRILLRFDLDEFTQKSSWGSESNFTNINHSAIQRVTLRLSCVSIVDSNEFSGSIQVSKILLPWDQTVVTSSVRNADGGNWWASGLDTTGRDATYPFIRNDVTVDYSSCQRGEAVLFDFNTRIFESWLDDPQSNYGILIWADLPPGVETTLKFASTENGHVERHPELVVLFQDSIIDSGTSCPSEQFECLDGSCIDQSKVCNFVDDCLHGNDEVACSIKCDFETACPWEAPPVSSGVLGWQIHSGPTDTSGTGPSGGQSDTGSDLSSRYLYVDASGKDKGALSHFISPLYSESGPRCSLHFFYHMYGDDVGALRVILGLGNRNVTVWEKAGSQQNRWLGDVLPLGRQREPFRVIFEAEGGDGEVGDIALDSLELMHCSPDLPREECSASYFPCDNLACIQPEDVCNLQKDCLLGEDEDSGLCGVIPFGGTCSFEDGWCGWQNVVQEGNFNWTRHNGTTKTTGTGPSVDHTLGTNLGHYIYTEVTSIPRGSEAFVRSVWFQPPPSETYDPASPHYRTCKVRFFYHMFGRNIGTLKLFAIRNTSSETSNQLFSESYENQDVWQSHSAYLPAITESYYLQFESTRGLSFRGDMAIDDISLSRQCFQVDDLGPSTVTPDPTTEFKIPGTRRSKLTEPVSPIPTLTSNSTTMFQFSTCGSKGEAGPTQFQCDIAYRHENISVTVLDGIQNWIVPVTRTYSMKIKGAGGGTGVENTSPSRGAEMEASFNLTAGDRLYILVGQEGEDACDDDTGEAPDFGASGICNDESLTDEERNRFGIEGNLAGGGGGGGGGTFVAKWDETMKQYIPLLVAGGGGGLGFSPGPTLEGVHGSVGAPGEGVSGSQGLAHDVSGAGGGWNNTGVNLTQVSGMAFLQGGRGGVECPLAHLEADWRTHGGFGGGGGGCTSGGGGGGYTGGDAPLFKDLFGSGKGGTSYVHPSGFNIKKRPGANLGAGEVVITAIVFCPAGTEPSKDGKSCVSIPLGHLLPLAAIVGSIVPVFIIILCVVVFIAIVYSRRKRELHEAEQRIDTADYQLSQLRHNASVDFNPCYQLGDGVVTVKDLKEVPRENLKLIRALGQGAFGEVYHGLFQPVDEKEAYEVAVKTLPERSTQQDESDFLMEALIMGNFDHPNVVSLKGVCFTQAPRFILLEFMAGGELRQFLRDSRPRRGQPSPLDMSDLLLLAHDVTKGCEYLESRRFIHRDIAARNVLLSCKERGRVAKIGDFGMARDIYRADYYRKGGQAMLPVKWMPPEAFLDGIFTSKTDVWSFGVLLWEIMSLGYMPYPGLSNQEVIHFTTRGQRMNAPRNCPKPIQELMYQCWQQDPDDRPSFSFIMCYIANCLQSPDVLNAPLPQELLDDDKTPAVTRPRNSKTSPVLKVQRSGSQPVHRAGAHGISGKGVVAPAEEDDQAYLTPDWVLGGRMKEHLLSDDRNANNSADWRGACGGIPVQEPIGTNHDRSDSQLEMPPGNESVNKLKRRQKAREEGHRGLRPDSDTSFDPPINQDGHATEDTDLLDRGDEGFDETSFVKLATPRNSTRESPRISRQAERSLQDSSPSVVCSGESNNVSCQPFTKLSSPRNSTRVPSLNVSRVAEQSSQEASPRETHDTNRDSCHSDRTEGHAGGSARETLPNGPSGTDSPPSSSFSPRILNRFRIPVFSRHSSFEVPSAQTQARATSNTSLPMLNRMQSMPVNPNPYTMTEFASQSGLARSSPDTSNVIVGSNNNIMDAARRRVMFNAQSGEVVFEDNETNGTVV